MGQWWRGWRSQRIIKVWEKVGVHTCYEAKINPHCTVKALTMDLSGLQHSLRLWPRRLPGWHERSSTSRQQGLPPLAKVRLALRRVTLLSPRVSPQVYLMGNTATLIKSDTPEFWLKLLHFSEVCQVRSLTDRLLSEVTGLFLRVPSWSVLHL